VTIVLRVMAHGLPQGFDKIDQPGFRQWPLAPMTRAHERRGMRGMRSGKATVTGPDRPDEVAPAEHGRTEPARVLVVEEHALVAAGLQLALAERSWHVETSDGPGARDVIEHAEAFQPHCVLLDVQMRNGIGSGIELIRPLVSTGSQVVMLTAERRRSVLAECLEAGAAGWIGSDAGLDEVDSALERVIEGRPIIGRTARAELLERLRCERADALRAQATFDQLTQREALVLSAMMEGLNAEEIAKSQFVAVTTVRSQIRSILQKLGVRSQLAAVALADGHRGLLPREFNAGRDRRRSEPIIRGSASGYSAHSA
jgi:two-component system, NarL family, nitrate/nitrite response regulator NarL